jgi:hypothetical protein
MQAGECGSQSRAAGSASAISKIVKVLAGVASCRNSVGRANAPAGLRIGELGEIESAAGERDRLGAGRDRAVRSEAAIRPGH